jgi:hypothetical protein
MILSLEEDKLGPPFLVRVLFYTGLSMTIVGCLLAFRRQSFAGLRIQWIVELTSVTAIATSVLLTLRQSQVSRLK